MNKQKSFLFKLTTTALLVGVAVVANRFLSINLPSISIGLTFVPLMLCGMLFGPLWGGICGGLADLIGATLFPFGTYFPGFTAVAFLSGVFFGLCGSAAKKLSGLPSFLALATLFILLQETVCHTLLNTLWISWLYSSPYLPLLVSRLPVAAVRAVLEIAFACLLKTAVLPAVNKALNKMN